MIALTYMRENLGRLNTLYLRARNSKEALFYSKLAILELCGWIEESMDDVVMRCAIRCLSDQANRDYVEKKVVKPTYGFEYDTHFRSMIVRVVGLRDIERLERRLDISIHTRFKATLSTLKLARNAEAHTHLKGVTKVLNAPSVTMSQFNDVYNGLRAYDVALRKYVV